MDEAGPTKNDKTELPSIVTTQPTSSGMPPPQYPQWPEPQAAPWTQNQQPPWPPNQVQPGFPPQQMGPVSNSNMSTTNNIIITTQPAVAGPPALRDWSSGLCDCCSDMDTCCMAWCCPACLQVQVAQDMGENCCSAFCYVCCTPASLFGLRVYLRGKANIQGSLLDDFQKASGGSCYYCCALAQIAREVKYVKNTRGYF